jgi:hypothetical protein
MVLLVCAVPVAFDAEAMNWEGHDDDWHLSLPYATAFEDAVGHLPKIQKPLPCVPSDQIGKIPENVYDQVPLRDRACPAPRALETR